MFPDQVSQAVLSHYDKLPPSAKPGTRSNGVHEWTVLAGVVAVVNSAIYPLTIATGVKAMPDEIRKYSSGKIVHDMHAEILALRLFNLFLLEECCKLEQGNSKFVEKFGDKFKLRDEIRLVLYISEPPCGDASLAYSAKGEEGWNEEPEKKRQKVLRGRSFFGRVGAVRTKPGRSDSLITLSKSCSDKLCAKQELGLTNALTAPLFPQNCYLDSIVVRDGLKSDFDRCFGRIETSHPIERQFCSQTFKNGKPAAEDLQLKKWSPSPLSAMKIVSSGTFQVLNNGVKNGSYVKGKPPKRGGESIVCNWSMAQRAKQLYKRSPLSGLTYHAYKTSLESRQRLKQKVRNQLQTWTPTSADDFTL